jgi:PhnB protein
MNLIPSNQKSEETVMKLNTYLNFHGNCAEAFRFYEKHLGGKVGMVMTFDQAPQEVKIDPEWKKKVLHARMSLGGTDLMGADIPNQQPMRSVYLTLGVDSDAEAERVWGVLAEGGEIFMPMQETFFATRFGQLRDQFGTSWMIICEKPMPPTP